MVGLDVGLVDGLDGRMEGSGFPSGWGGLFRVIVRVCAIVLDLESSKGKMTKEDHSC